MNLLDLLIRTYLNNNEVFADIINGHFHKTLLKAEAAEYDGMWALDAPWLNSAEGQSFKAAFNILFQNAILRADSQRAYLIIGISGKPLQSKALAPAAKAYEALYRRHMYTHEGKADAGLLALAVYFGTEKWTAPLSIRELTRQTKPEEVNPSDYRLELLQPALLGENELKYFHTGFKNVARLLADCSFWAAPEDTKAELTLCLKSYIDRAFTDSQNGRAEYLKDRYLLSALMHDCLEEYTLENEADIAFRYMKYDPHPQISKSDGGTRYTLTFTAESPSGGNAVIAVHFVTGPTGDEFSLMEKALISTAGLIPDPYLEENTDPSVPRLARSIWICCSPDPDTANKIINYKMLEKYKVRNGRPVPADQPGTVVLSASVIGLVTDPHTPPASEIIRILGVLFTDIPQ